MTEAPDSVRTVHAGGAALRYADILWFIRLLSGFGRTQGELAPAAEFLKRNDIPWEAVAMLAEMEGVGGVMYRHLQVPALAGLASRNLMDRLEAFYLRHRRFNTWLLKEVRELSALLKNENIPAMALQGLAMMPHYRDPGLRPLGDVDLMIPPHVRRRFREIAGSAGYRPAAPDYPDLLCKGGICLDVHTHLLNLERIRNRRHLFPADLSSMWEQAALFSSEYPGLLCPSHADRFIAACAHGLKHGYSRLIWLADLHLLLNHLANIRGGWDMLVDRAHFWKQDRAVLFALVMMRNVFQQAIPESIMRKMAGGRLKPLEKRMAGLMFRGVKSPLYGHLLWLSQMKGPGSRLFYLSENLFPEKRVMRQILRDNGWGSGPSGYLRRLISMTSSMGKEFGKIVFPLSGK